MNERKKLNRAIHEREESIAAEQERKTVILANLGQSVYDSKAIAAKALEPYRKKIEAINEKIRELEETLRLLLQTDEKKRAVQEESKSLKVELRNLKNKEELLFEDLGKSSWELWKSGRSIHPAMEEALEGLIKADSRLHAAEDAVLKTEQEASNKSIKLLSRGKALLLAGKKKTASTALDRLWGPAGEKIFQTIPGGSFSDTPASDSFSALEALEKRRDEISSRSAALKEEAAALEKELEELAGKNTVKKKVVMIEASLEREHDNLDEAFCNLGKAWLDLPAGKTLPSVVKKRKEEWEAINKKIADLEEERAVFSAHSSLLESEDLRNAKAKQLEKLEEEIKSRQVVLKGLKKELSRLDKEIAKEKEGLSPLPE